MPTRLLSIIVIAYNEERYLPALLKALRCQSERGFELIVVDSNSTDGTAAVAHEFAAGLPGFRYLKLPEAQGPAYARNSGAQIASCNRLLFLDSDTILHPEFLFETTAELESRRVDVATCPLRIIEDSLFSRSGAIFLNTAMRVLSPLYASAYGACLFSTRQAHGAVGGFDQRIGICEDCHYVKTARRQGFRFRVLRPAFYTSDRRVQHEGSVRIMTKYIRCHLRRMLTGREILKQDVIYQYGDF